MLSPIGPPVRTRSDPVRPHALSHLSIHARGKSATEREKRGKRNFPHAPAYRQTGHFQPVVFLRGEPINLATNSLRSSSIFHWRSNCTATTGLTVHRLLIGVRSSGASQPAATRGETCLLRSKTDMPRRWRTLRVMSRALMRFFPLLSIQLASFLSLSPTVVVPSML